MGIFNMNFNKPGKGVEKGDMDKNMFIAGIKTFIRNIWNLVKTNFFCSVASIPMVLILVAFFTILLYPTISPVIDELVAAAENTNTLETEATYLSLFACVFVAEALFLIGSGPASVALSYAIKCFSKDEHLWVWSDFKNQFISNFKQGIIVTAIDLFVMFISISGIMSYVAIYRSMGGIINIILPSIVCIFLLIYILMHGYIWQMIATFNNKLPVLYKNSLILAIAKFPQTLFFYVIPVVITFYIFTRITAVFATILILVIWTGAMRFPMEFYAAKTIEKLLDKEAEQDVKGQEE